VPQWLKNVQPIADHYSFQRFQAVFLPVIVLRGEVPLEHYEVPLEDCDVPL